MRRSEQGFLDSLEAIFLERGANGITIAMLAKELKCSRRKIYEHAESKDKLFVVVMERFFARVRADGDAATKGMSDVGQQLRAYLAPGVAGAARLSDAVQADLSRKPEAKAIYDRHQAMRSEGLREILERGVATGVLEKIDATVAAEMMLMFVREARDPDFQKRTGKSYDKALAAAYQIFEHALRKRAS